MVPPAQRLCESCVLGWGWISETVPGAHLHLPGGNLFLLSFHVSPTATQYWYPENEKLQVL